ncbi:reverse transcriptase domain-containing protein [Tanacetum coccineum]
MYAYLAVSREAVSAVLLTDRNGRQCPIQYVSRTLNEAERNYSPLGKLALSLVNMTRRLRRYLEAHPVKVITDQPIKNILSRTEASGKLAKYAVEIGTYKISFIPQNAVKGQVLADFLSDAPDGEREDEYFRRPEVSPRIDDTKAWTLYTDGAASSKGSGAEYEALLAGLRIARMMNVLWIEVKVDSKLVASQVNGTYEASKGSMIKYLAKARKYISEFKTFSIENIPRGNNQKADVLSKLATVPFHHLTKEILVEVLSERSTEVQEVQTIVEEEGDNWMTPIIKYLEEGIVPSDNNEARALRAKIGQYTMESGVLFKKGYLIPMLRCVGPLQANYVIREIHMGSCGMHVGPRAVVRKAMRQGYYWPTMHADAKTEVDKCDSCQIHSPIPRLPKTFMTSIMAPWPFYQWGMDILGPLTPARGGAKFVIVAIDYFTKWVEAKPLVKITGKEIIRFVMDNIICRYGLPRVIVTDNGAQLKATARKPPSCLPYVSEAVISEFPAEIGMPSYNRTLMIREEFQPTKSNALNLTYYKNVGKSGRPYEKPDTSQEWNILQQESTAQRVIFMARRVLYRRNEASRWRIKGSWDSPSVEGPIQVYRSVQNCSLQVANNGRQDSPSDLARDQLTQMLFVGFNIL